MQDPLSELVKIDPKSIGIGLYQHDVDQNELGRTLSGVVESVVNWVGVDVNTASPALLTYVSGIGPKLAAAVVTFRDDNGPFNSREALKNVPKLGGKTFEQAAGFLFFKKRGVRLEHGNRVTLGYGAKDGGCGHQENNNRFAHIDILSLSG